MIQNPNNWIFDEGALNRACPKSAKMQRDGHDWRANFRAEVPTAGNL
jgi:hypothetical protein